jgi:hypothetical protein
MKNALVPRPSGQGSGPIVSSTSVRQILCLPRSKAAGTVILFQDLEEMPGVKSCKTKGPQDIQGPSGAPVLS